MSRSCTLRQTSRQGWLNHHGSPVSKALHVHAILSLLSMQGEELGLHHKGLCTCAASPKTAVIQYIDIIKPCRGHILYKQACPFLKRI